MFREHDFIWLQKQIVELDEIIDGVEYYKIKDDNIKDLVRENRMINAYIWYIINEFDMIRRKPPQSILNNREIEKEEEYGIRLIFIRKLYNYW